mgnify:CR=1 FL=1
MNTKIQPITHILCDLSDVLIKGIEGSEVVLAKELGLNVEHVSNELFSYDFRSFWVVTLTEDEFFVKFINDKRWTISVKRFKEIIRDHFYEIEGTRDIYLKLKEKYTLVLLSVNAREWVKYLENKYHYSSIFDNIIYSYEIGYTKREPESFAFVVDNINIKPGNLLLIDDSSRNIAVAETMGIKGIKFIDTTQLRDELCNLKLL